MLVMIKIFKGKNKRLSMKELPDFNINIHQAINYIFLPKMYFRSMIANFHTFIQYFMQKNGRIKKSKINKRD